MNREDYLCLDVPIGLVHNVTNINNTITDELTIKLSMIKQLLPAPWKKLDAIKTFVQPCLTYAFQSMGPTTNSLQNFRAQLIRTVRSICSLTTRATSHYIFGPKCAGSLGLQIPVLRTNSKQQCQP